MDPTPALEQFVHQWASKLATAHPRIERCEVMIERPHENRRHGTPFRVRVAVAIPGPDVIVSHDVDLDGAHEDVYVALRDAFRSARRQLQDRQDARQPSRTRRPRLAGPLASR